MSTTKPTQDAKEETSKNALVRLVLGLKDEPCWQALSEAKRYEFLLAITRMNDEIGAKIIKDYKYRSFNAEAGMGTTADQANKSREAARADIAQLAGAKIPQLASLLKWDEYEKTLPQDEHADFGGAAKETLPEKVATQLADAIAVYAGAAGYAREERPRPVRGMV